MWRPNWQQAKVVERVHLLHGLEHNAALRAIEKKLYIQIHLAIQPTAIQPLPEAIQQQYKHCQRHNGPRN